jgi:SAM-dependent methyltransferase
MNRLDDFPPHAQTNRAHWNRHAEDWRQIGRCGWRRRQPAWGNWEIPNTELPLLPDDLSGLDAIDLGCGAGQVCFWMHQRGARSVVGIDPSERQLEIARALAVEYRVELELIHGVAEAVPRPDATFDFALSEYGASVWADPLIWIPEAWRLLRPGGRLSFIGRSTLSLVCAPPDDGPIGTTLQRDWFGLQRVALGPQEDPYVVFNLPISEWFALFRRIGFVVDDFYEVRAPASATGQRFETPADWARRFPSEQAWRLSKPQGSCQGPPSTAIVDNPTKDAYSI